VSPHRIAASGEAVTPSEATDQSTIIIALTRMEAKMDVALAQHGARLDSAESNLADHETRIRVIEAKPTVSPGKLWTAVTGGAALVLASIPLMDRVLGQ